MHGYKILLRAILTKMAILKREANITPGEMGRRDIYVLNSIIEASETNKAVNLKRFYT